MNISRNEIIKHIQYKSSKHHHGLEHTTLAPNLMNYSHMFKKYINIVKNGNIGTRNNKSRVKKFSRDDGQQLLGDSKCR